MNMTTSWKAIKQSWKVIVDSSKIRRQLRLLYWDQRLHMAKLRTNRAMRQTAMYMEDIQAEYDADKAIQDIEDTLETNQFTIAEVEGLMSDTIQGHHPFVQMLSRFIPLELPKL